ncbi:MAG: hypothetical protein RIT43_2321 [Bacteroidota bacterium]|jgi:hypothetical protein
MKKQRLSLITGAFLCALLIAPCSTNAQVPTYVPANGLVAWWPFNGNANDESGNGNNGTVNGATLTMDRFGMANSAYYFNVANWTWGANGDYIYVPYNSMFNFSEFTISSWVYRTSDGATISPQALSIIRRFEYGYSDPNGEAWTLDLAHGTSANGSLVYGGVIEQSTLDPAPSSICSSTEAIPVNQWHQVIMTYSQSTIKIYIDGQLNSTTTDPSIVINTTGNSGISIGLSDQANGHWGPFDGNIDDIVIWNRALTDQEISALYQGCSGNITSQPSNQSVNASAGTIQFTVSASATSPSYQWQTNLGLGFQNLSDAGQYSGTATNSLTVNNLTISNNNQQFRCIINDGACVDTTDVATLTIIDDLGFEHLEMNGTKKLLKITDLNGKETPFRKNAVLLFIYEDGTVERVFEAE